MADRDEIQDDEVVYQEYIKSLPLKTVLANYFKASFFEPLSVLRLGFLLILKTPLMLSVPGKTACSWQVYCMGLRALPISYGVARKELILKLFY